MKQVLIIISVVLSSPVFSQSHRQLVHERVGDKTIVGNWKIGEVKEAYGVRVLRTEGTNSADHRTNVLYIPQNHLLAQLRELSSVEPVYNKDYEALAHYYTEQYPGGQVAIFFDRISMELANPSNFTVILVDPETGREVYTERLEREVPYCYKWDIWYYYSVINVPIQIGEKVIVRIWDDGLQQSSEFLIYDNMPPVQLPASVVSAGR